MKLYKSVEGIEIYQDRNDLYIKLNQLAQITEPVKTILLGENSNLDIEFNEKRSILSDIMEIRGNYTFNINNKYIQTFTKYREEIYDTLCKRYSKGQVSHPTLHIGFEFLQGVSDVSLPAFLSMCGLTHHMALMDFIFIVNRGIISAPSKEAKGCQLLCKWLQEKKIAVNDIEDAFWWMRKEKKYLAPSLTSLASILSDYQSRYPLQKTTKGDTLESLIGKVYNI